MLSWMPWELVAPGFEALSADKRFSSRMREKFRLLADPYLTDLE